MTLRSLILALLMLQNVVLAQQEGIPRNIIIMIGDGMGVSQVTAGRTLKGTLALDEFKTLGLLLTHAVGKDYVTDSAAGATALSTGVKTYNGAIGLGPDSVAMENVLERARKRGRKTGVVVACSITHATPACFLAHVPSRNMQLEIAEQISRGPTDVLLGGGWGWFLPESMGGRRKDGKKLRPIRLRLIWHVQPRVSNPTQLNHPDSTNNPILPASLPLPVRRRMHGQIRLEQLRLRNITIHLHGSTAEHYHGDNNSPKLCRFDKQP